MKNAIRTLIIIAIVILIVVALAHHLDLGTTFRELHGS